MYAQICHKICIYMQKIYLILVCINMHTIYINMHTICIQYADICIKYAQNNPLHRLQHSKYADYMQNICKIYAQICKKNYAQIMHKIYRMCTTLCLAYHDFAIYMHSPLCWCKNVISKLQPIANTCLNLRNEKSICEFLRNWQLRNLAKLVFGNLANLAKHIYNCERSFCETLLNSYLRNLRNIAEHGKTLPNTNCESCESCIALRNYDPKSLKQLCYNGSRDHLKTNTWRCHCRQAARRQSPMAPGWYLSASASRSAL